MSFLTKGFQRFPNFGPVVEAKQRNGIWQVMAERRQIEFPAERNMARQTTSCTPKPRLYGRLYMYHNSTDTFNANAEPNKELAEIQMSFDHFRQKRMKDTQKYQLSSDGFSLKPMLKRTGKSAASLYHNSIQFSSGTCKAEAPTNRTKHGINPNSSFVRHGIWRPVRAVVVDHHQADRRRK